MDSWKPPPHLPPPNYQTRLPLGAHQGVPKPFVCCLKILFDFFVIFFDLARSLSHPWHPSPQITSKHGSFPPSLALSRSLSLLHTLYFNSHEYTEHRQMSQIHHLRDAPLIEKKSRHVWVGDVNWLEFFIEYIYVCVCACHCTRVFVCASTRVFAACGFAGIPVRAWKERAHFVSPRMCGGQSRSAYCPSDVWYFMYKRVAGVRE